MTGPDDNLADELKLLRKMEAAADTLRTLPARMADYYANGGPGVGQAVVGDRYQGQGNSRFAPLSERYAKWKAGHAKEFSKEAKAKFGKGSKLIKALHYTHAGPIGGTTATTSLPILVLHGDLRAAVISRQHAIEQQGDIGYAVFANLPFYAKWHQTGTKRMPRRSPVDPNPEDMERVYEFAKRIVSAAVGQGKVDTLFGQGNARIL